ncbi:Enoyl-CoA hydratase/carnithine racemase [Desulfurella multipotens]|uniref:Enoyl-CoA hydratase/carnithine racemase n=1 Tax=Desulfurella multipotens TaxID=79269 RepID=A0A1G6KZ52_9BACT|nr:enoyl-CoA hydratase/isomerase family protein [Desulfurella multipotens]SDC36088.1 Enoyl-CoA hydratase/carnithine racemase [Desulfurella multipotens]
MESIIIKKNELISTIILNKPKQFNAFDIDLATDLNNALKELDKDDSTRVIIIQGSKKYFSVSISLEELQNKSVQQAKEFVYAMNEFYHTIHHLRKPTIASVSGYAVANGAGLLFACDLAVCSKSTKIGITAINVGLCGIGASLPLRYSLSKKIIMEMLLTGKVLNAYQAKRMLMVNKVVDGKFLEEETYKLAFNIAQKNSSAIEITKIGIENLTDMEFDKAVDYSSDLFSYIVNLEETKSTLIKKINKKRGGKND